MITQSIACGLLIYLVGESGEPVLWISLSILFALMMQGVFSMMHECIHGNGHPNPLVNNLIGVLSAALFGTSYTLLRVNHEGHHVRNRTPPELAEYFLPGDHRIYKTIKYYFAICGGIWVGAFLAIFLLPLIPYRLIHKLNRPAPSMNGYSMAFEQYSERDWNLQRLDSLFTVVLWAGAIWMFSFSLSTIIGLYLLFAFSWSSLQWIYHLRTPLDPIEGAYNLRIATPVRWLFLNFNYNLSHHRDPAMHWQRLHGNTNMLETQPLWARYIGAFKPPEPYPDQPDSLVKTYF